MLIWEAQHWFDYNALITNTPAELINCNGEGIYKVCHPIGLCYSQSFYGIYCIEMHNLSVFVRVNQIVTVILHCHSTRTEEQFLFSTFSWKKGGMAIAHNTATLTQCRNILCCTTSTIFYGKEQRRIILDKMATYRNTVLL